MNGKELFLGLSYINRKYIEEAEKDTVSSFSAQKRSRLRRPLLIAAVIALTLLLVGCAVAASMCGSVLPGTDSTATKIAKPKIGRAHV